MKRVPLGEPNSNCVNNLYPVVNGFSAFSSGPTLYGKCHYLPTTSRAGCVAGHSQVRKRRFRGANSFPSSDLRACLLTHPPARPRTLLQNFASPFVSLFERATFGPAIPSWFHSTRVPFLCVSGSVFQRLLINARVRPPTPNETSSTFAAYIYSGQTQEHPAYTTVGPPAALRSGIPAPALAQ